MTTISIDTNSIDYGNDEVNSNMPPKQSFRVGNTVITIDSKYMFCRSILSECLSTYDLDDIDYIWGIDNIIPLIMEDPNIDKSWGVPSRNTPLIASMELPWPKLLLFILHGCRQLNVGLLSFVYRYEIKNAIKNKDLYQLDILLNLAENDRWPEKVHNILLTDAEINKLDIMKNKEVAALSNLISEGRTMNPPYLDGFVVCPTDPLTTQNNNLFSQCYNDICFKSTSASEISSNTVSNDTIVVARDDMEGSDNVMLDTNIFTFNNNNITDESSFGSTPTCMFFGNTCQNEENNTRCYSLEEILEILSTNNYSSQIIFGTKDQESQLRLCLSTEIKLYQGYLDYMRLL
uniref:Uncharacterized protein n=1 Tax=Pithovirus LCPAC101 TaxID=2506586 RepID=A0A481Z2F9_9VIRU|nr:MAG: uncharacterized protein LCPAC101_01690 [Pithovirus LCPAC101]